MSKMGNFILEVEEYVNGFLGDDISEERILAMVKSVYGSFGMGIAQDYLDRAYDRDYDRSPV